MKAADEFSHVPNELLRKSLHIAFGLFAFSLRWLPWWMAAAVALCAVIGNWLVLHRLVGTRVSRHQRGWDAGIVLYPLSVLALIVVFRDDLHVAGLAWAALAFGDGFATLVGKSVRGPRLPWNRDKSWSGLIGFVLFSVPPLLLLSYHLSDEVSWLPRWLAVTGVAVAGAIAESLPLGIDDNITVPVAAATAAALLFTPLQPRLNLDATAMWWLALNAVLAVAGYLARSVDVSGMAGGWVLGAILIVFGWPTLYIALLAFFITGTAATKLGYRKKAQQGLAQEKGGRRGFGHAFANVGVAAICALAMAMTGRTTLFWWAAVASLATAAADTIASEIGQLAGRRTFLPLTFRPVPRGTEGAVSVEGTLAGVGGALIVALAAAAVFPGASRMAWAQVAFVTLCAVAGSYIESIAGHWNRTRSLGIANGALNFFNTAAGALLFVLIAPHLQWLFQ